MKAIVLRSTGGPEQLSFEEVPLPEAGPEEVVVRLEAASVNHRDVWIRLGRYAGIQLPVILGSDGSGTVVRAGDEAGKRWIGREVVINPSLFWGENELVQGPKWKILGLPDDGTYAEEIRVPVSSLGPKPSHLSFEQSAAIPLAGLTAYRALVVRGNLRRGELVVVTGIGGGVAMIALQLARGLNARVFVTSGTDEKIRRAVELGAEGGVNYHDPEWVKKLTALCDGVGPDLVIDGNAGETLDCSLDLLRPGGRLVLYGATAGPANNLQARRIFWKHLTVTGSTMGTDRDFSQMLEFISFHSIAPAIDGVYPLHLAAEAHRRMEDVRRFGKIVLKVS